MASKSMTIQEMQKVCDELQGLLADKGKSGAEAMFWIESHTEYLFRLCWRKPNAINSWDTQGEAFRGADTYDLVDQARKFIASLPTAEETKFREFMGALGNVIDLARKNGIEVEFINPLTETMKRLSENALTDQRVAS
ncbi:hypothetical protein QBD01_003719 [Ochrobactrum sp. 19YEA23]|uniref:hypothetical protein n=1 Tax=Ochrobactrum sp. 19YEA23 TaxID=3039854 RepID=UPI00247A4359|nr:hypothetical protein [Ochrobactrum sp. 19YEA23]